MKIQTHHGSLAEHNWLKFFLAPVLRETYLFRYINYIDSYDICRTMTKIESWFKAFRLRTLPLSFSSVILGSMLALYRDAFQFPILIGALTTTLFLQILSNLANDYGDFKNGIDNDKRLGPQRSVQSGIIKPHQMVVGMIICALLALASGLWLLYEVSKTTDIAVVLTFLFIGLLAVAAALKYTVGKNPYGYKGFGDIAVFLFFGITGVAGTYFLHTNEIAWPELLPAVSIGLLATGVLNLNNLRDIENDREQGKRTLVVIMGLKYAKRYHSFLIFGAIAAIFLYTFLRYHSNYQFLFLMAVPLLVQNVIIVSKSTNPSAFDAELKKLAVATLLFAITIGIGLNY